VAEQPAPITAEECIEFVRSMNGLQRALRTRLRPVLEQDHGVDLALFVVLKQIESGVVHAGRIAQGTMLHPSQITRQLDKLEHLGLIERTLDREDSRRIRLALTPAAHEMFRSIETAFAEQLGPALAGIAPERRRVLVEAIQQLDEALS
jgi:DNA-binding MarR family transcriptional regulator